MEYHFNEKIEELLKSRHRTKKSLYEAIGMSMQGFDSMMKANSFTAARLGAIADFFEVPVADLYNEKNESQKNKRTQPGTDQYLQEHLAALEQSFEKLLEQLTAKDNQIAGLQESQRNLQDMLKMVLGKSKSVIFTQLSSEEKEFYKGYDNYVDSAVQTISDMYGAQVKRPVLLT